MSTVTTKVRIMRRCRHGDMVKGDPEWVAYVAALPRDPSTGHFAEEAYDEPFRLWLK